MKKIYKETDVDSIIKEIESYIGQTSNEERTGYRQELESVKNNFTALVGSGVFRDACGKIVDSRRINGICELTVVQEY